MKMLFKGHSTRLELLIEKIHSNKENNSSCHDSENSGSSSGTVNTDMESISSASVLESPKSHSSETDPEIERDSFSVPNELINLTLDIPENESSAYNLRDSLESDISDQTKHYEGILQFNCKYCPRLFKHKRSRDRHVKLHTGDKKYKCLQCHSAFARSDHLKIHIKTHDIRKNFKCNSCNKGYNTASALAFHQRMHLSEMEDRSEESSPHSSPKRGLSCYHCTEIFNSSESLKNHLILTKKDPKLPSVKSSVSDTQADLTTFCVYCFQRFSNTRDMFNHVKSVHRNEISSTVQTNSDFHESSSEIFNHLGKYTRRDYNISMTVQDISFENNYLTQSGQMNILSKKRKEIHIENKTLKKKYVENNTISNLNEPFICACCYVQLPNFKSFLIHMENHMSTSKTEFNGICVFCGEEISNSSTLSNHIFRHSVKQLKNYCCCCTCDKSFSEQENLQKHLLDEHVICVFKCAFCKEIFDDKLSMKMHLSSKHTYDFEHFECNMCPSKIFHNKTSAELHVSKSHFDESGFMQTTHNDIQQNENFNCVFCDKVFSDHYTRYMHILEEHSNNDHLSSQSQLCENEISHREEKTSNEESFGFDIPDEGFVKSTQKLGAVSLRCAYCKEYCNTKTELQHHLKIHHNSAKLKYKCNICDELYSSATKLANHKLIHCKIVDGNICLQCKSIINDRDTFYKHQLKHNTAKPNIKSSLVLPPSICIICSQTLQSDMEIELHAKFHLKFVMNASKKAENCLNCNSEFSSLNNDQSLCGKCFNGGEREDFQLKSLKLAYKDQNKLHCYLCKNYFNTQEKLQIHLIEHNFFGINQYSCYVCSSVFTAATGLKTHLLEHNLKEKPYQCSVCQISFFFRAELDNHRYTHNFQTHYEHFSAENSQLQTCSSSSSDSSKMREKFDKTEPDI